jgi:uncharacterized protein YbgA (DUF1722 family)/uncharacterized protein YbbK (DUF523 family)
MSQSLIRVGISTCLLGEKVRFDGGHKHDPLLTDLFGRYFEWVAVCPEVEIGLGTPRESLRLVASSKGTRLVAQKSGTDHTDAMQDWAALRLQELQGMELRGYVLKKDSPSCGMERVRVYGEAGMPQRQGRGIWAAALLDRFDLLPVEEEGRLHDMPIRENFIERVFAYDRWCAFLELKPRARDLVAFHTRHKLTLLSHSDSLYRGLGQMVSRAGRTSKENLLHEYAALFMQALRLRATPRKHANVLYHLIGYLKKDLDAEDKAELVACVEMYRQGLVPLIVPITLLQHHFRRHPNPWVGGQTYMNPYPAELMLRNHV